MRSAGPLRAIALPSLALAAALLLAGCDGGARSIDDIQRQVQREWEKIEHSTEVQFAVGGARTALQELQEASRAGARAAHDKALEAMRATIRELYSAWKSAMRAVESYDISPKCLLAMAVGGGAVTATSGLALAALGFAEEGVAAESLAALWQSALGNVEAGSLFARLQSLGAKGLSASQRFVVRGSIATISATVCGVVNELCHHCISDAGHNASLVVNGGSDFNGAANATASSGGGDDDADKSADYAMASNVSDLIVL